MKELDAYLKAGAALQAIGCDIDLGIEDLRQVSWNGDRDFPQWEYLGVGYWKYEGETTSRGSVMERGDLVFLELFSDTGGSPYWVVFDKGNVVEL